MRKAGRASIFYPKHRVDSCTRYTRDALAHARASTHIRTQPRPFPQKEEKKNGKKTGKKTGRPDRHTRWAPLYAQANQQPPQYAPTHSPPRQPHFTIVGTHLVVTLSSFSSLRHAAAAASTPSSHRLPRKRLISGQRPNVRTTHTSELTGKAGTTIACVLLE